MKSMGEQLGHDFLQDTNGYHISDIYIIYIYIYVASYLLLQFANSLPQIQASHTRFGAFTKTHRTGELFCS